MPIYEYRCTSCGKQVEKIQSMNSEPLRTCEHCGGELERLVSAAAIQFKGTGWYVTDYSRKGAAPPAESKPAETKPESKPAGESAPAPKSEPPASSKS